MDLTALNEILQKVRQQSVPPISTSGQVAVQETSQATTEVTEISGEEGLQEEEPEIEDVGALGVDIIEAQGYESIIIFPEAWEYKALFPAFFTLGDVTTFKNLVKAVALVVEEAQFEVTREAVSFKAMDPSHISLIDILIPRDACQRFEYSSDTPRRFTVRVEDLERILSRTKREDTIRFDVEAETCETTLRNGRDRTFSLHLLDVPNNTVPMPKLSFNSKIMLVKSAFQDILKDIEAFGDHVTIEAQDREVIFSGKSDSGKSRAKVDRTDADLLELQVREPSKATFSIDYLTGLLKAVEAEIITVEYSTKLPLRAEMPLDELGSRIHYFLAPRIEG